MRKRLKKKRMKLSIKRYVASIQKYKESVKKYDEELAKRICSYCKKVMREGPNDNVTHGICEPCSTKMLWLDGLSETELTDFINMMKEKYGDKL